MLDYIEATFARTDLRQIRAFILQGTEDINVKDESYKTRLEQCDNAIIKRLESIYSDETELDIAIPFDINTYACRISCPPNGWNDSILSGNAIKPIPI